MRGRGESTLTTPTPRLLDIKMIYIIGSENVLTSPVGTYLT